MSARRCFCPLDCGCRDPQRVNVCGCREHDVSSTTSRPTSAAGMSSRVGWLAVAAVSAAGWVMGCSQPPAATIGDDKVPAGMHCQEDEAIVLMGTPQPVCVNVGDLVAGEVAR